MDQLEAALGKLLENPNAMAQVMSLAQSLGGLAPQEPTKETQELKLPIQGLDKLFSQLGNDGKHAALFRALGPFLSPKRREKLDRAMQLARLSSLASLALQQTDREDAKGG